MPSLPATLAAVQAKGLCSRQFRRQLVRDMSKLAEMERRRDVFISRQPKETKITKQPLFAFDATGKLA